MYTRTTFDSSNNVLGQWIYSTERTPSSLPGPVPIYEQMVNTVTDPLGNRREHYYSVYVSGSGTAGITSLREGSTPITFITAP